MNFLGIVAALDKIEQSASFFFFPETLVDFKVGKNMYNPLCTESNHFFFEMEIKMRSELEERGHREMNGNSNQLPVMLLKMFLENYP